MRRRTVLGGIVAAVVGAGGLAVAAAASDGGAASASSPGTGYGGYGASSTHGGTASPSPAATAPGVTVRTGATTAGRVLTDGAGRTLYLFEADRGAMSACEGSCAAVWPPLTTAGSVQAGDGASQQLLGSIRRGDGSTQVTYGGHPLYSYAGDGKPGDVAGQGLRQFGAPWYVLDAHGTKIDND